MKIVTGFRILAAPLAMLLLSQSATAEDISASAADDSKNTETQRDRLDLDTTSVTGNQELPKVLYIVPWKDADAGDLAGRPVNSLLDEVLAPVDREVFQRQIRYFDQLHASGSSLTQASESDK